MNRNFANGGKIWAMHVYPVAIDCTIQIGASGAVSSFVGPLITSVVHNSTGNYTISLSEPLFKLYAAHGSMQSASGGLSGISAIEIQNAPNASVSSASAPSLTIQTLNPSGSLADPASGSAINLLMLLSNSSVQVGGE